MTPRRDPTPESAGAARLASALEGLDAGQLQAVAAELVARFGGPPGVEHAPAASVLRPRRDDVVTYRVRVDLDDVRPPVWRRLELASDTVLPVLHDVLQAAMGWSDSHLHRFAVGGPLFSREAVELPTEVDLSEGDTGTAEADVRLDEVLAEVGDRLHYAYDFGDGWEHTVALEAVLPRGETAPRARCTAGRRACPPEDVGGMPGYEMLLEALADPASGDDPDVAERLAWAGPFDPAAFDLAETDVAVRAAADSPAVDPGALPPAVAELLERAQGPGRRGLLELVAAARLDTPEAPLDGAELTALAAAHRRLLDLVGADGVRLTQAGYLPPAVVRQLVDVVDPQRAWLTSSDRESDHLPVLVFREGAEELRLVRRVKNRLVLAPAGRAGRDDAAALVRHLAARLPLGSKAYERDAGLVVLVAAAAGLSPVSGDGGAALVAAVDALGWSTADGAPLDAYDVRRAAGTTVEVLEAVGALLRREPSGGGPEPSVSPTGARFARLALRGPAEG